jgi:hypothetical protein
MKQESKGWQQQQQEEETKSLQWAQVHYK